MPGIMPKAADGGFCAAPLKTRLAAAPDPPIPSDYVAETVVSGWTYWGSRCLVWPWLGMLSRRTRRAKGQAVAVMPFRDLSSGSRFVGEAIRETVTTDLKQLGSLRVVERGNLIRSSASRTYSCKHRSRTPRRWSRSARSWAPT